MNKKNKTEQIELKQFTNSLGLINEKKLFSLIYGNTSISRTNSDVTPSAHTIHLCKPSHDHVPDEIALWSKILALENKDRLLFYIAVLQFTAGLRISEVLNISVYDIALSGHVSIQSLKHSANAVVHGGVVSPYLIDCKKNGVNPFSAYSRFYVYRQFKKHSIYFQSSSSSKASVTHAMRHVSAKSLRSSGINKDQIQKFLRHKNPKNTERYGNS